jgi:hypothetical protein
MDPNVPVKKQRSPLFYIAMGCGGLMALIVAGMLVAALMVAQCSKSMVDGITDPSAKAANVKKMLGTTPTGYYPVMTFSIPMMMEMAMLGDHPPPPDGGFPDFERGFMYFRVIATEQTSHAEEFFDGKTSDPSALRGSGINIDAKDVIKRGTVKTIGGTVVKYVATRGTMELQGQRERRDQAGLNTAMYFVCPGDTAVRMGVWMMPDPEPNTPVDKLELKGTVADEDEVTKFLAPLTPCGK